MSPNKLVCVFNASRIAVSKGRGTTNYVCVIVFLQDEAKFQLQLNRGRKDGEIVINRNMLDNLVKMMVSVCTHSHSHTHMHTHTHARTHVRTHTHTHTHTHARTHTHTHREETLRSSTGSWCQNQIRISELTLVGKI